MHDDVQRIDEVFWEAARLAPGEQREGYLARACGEDPALRQRVERLLHVQPKVEGFLERPFAGPGQLPAVEEPPAEGPGTVIGPTSCWSRSAKAAWGWCSWRTSSTRSAAASP